MKLNNKTGELQFEKMLIDHLVNMNGTKQWEYREDIKTTEDLWENFKNILERHNQAKLDKPLSVTEFNQVKRAIESLKTPYQAGQFLYGYNGVSQIEVDLDDGRHEFLTVFDQKHVGAGDTVYQVVNQIRRKAKISGKQDRIFDTTLLINGLPIIQIEEKECGHDVKEAFNQMKQYASEGQYSDIFSTLQILVGMTENSIRYMANTPSDKFNMDFTFQWQYEDTNKAIYNWRDFANQFLSIPMAHQMATNYMILDGTKNKQMLRVMRPYQVYATQRVINKIKRNDFEFGEKKLGYVWHTTGSGKTITSFKTAWLASRLPNVEKVVFVVDRTALTNQTTEKYRAYDPDGETDDAKRKIKGVVDDTSSTFVLEKKLNSKDNNIIVTSVHKLRKLVGSSTFKEPDKRIVFIVDEAHRSTGANKSAQASSDNVNFEDVQNAFKKAVWIGYTGTPMFDKTSNGKTTQEVFGELLHAYTIREAISDKNVLGFKVDFETTINKEKMESEYLPAFYKNKYPKWSDEKIREKIQNLTDEDIDDTVGPSFYDENEEHVKLVVEDIFKNWRNRSNDGKYNALFTTHVGGGKPSVPMALMYFREFQRINEENKKNGGLVLKVAVTFSKNTSNGDFMLESNEGLHEAIKVYNSQFNTKWDMTTVDEYTADVASRLDRTNQDKNFLDLVIVVDQLLTGFDAPELNTLYVDRILKGAGLIQAYSRTNRIADNQGKPWGRIVNYRWPAQNERLMNEALATYADKDSATKTAEQMKCFNEENELIEKPFHEVFEEVKVNVDKLRDFTNDFTEVPRSEAQQKEMLNTLHKYNRGMAKLKQFNSEEVDGEIVGFNYDKPEEILECLGITIDEEERLRTTLVRELKSRIAESEGIPVQQLELKMTHIKNIKINYDYLTELQAKLINALYLLYKEDLETAAEIKMKIDQFADGLENESRSNQIKLASQKIYDKEINLSEYISEEDKEHFLDENGNLKKPITLGRNESQYLIQKVHQEELGKKVFQFRLNWGLTEVIPNDDLLSLLTNSMYVEDNSDPEGKIQDLLMKASKQYKMFAQKEDVKELIPIRYKNKLRSGLSELAKELKNF